MTAGLRLNPTTSALTLVGCGRNVASLQTITDYKEKRSRELPSDASRPDELNAFYVHVEASNTEPFIRAPAFPDDCVITLSVADVRPHINTIIPETLDWLQFTYHPNRSTVDAISIVVHTALSHLDKRSTYLRMLFIDYSSAFNTIVPSKLITKLRSLELNTSLCNWKPWTS